MLELSKIRKSFGRRRVLRGIDLSVGRGEILGLLGPNGSGKSTTIRIAAGYYAADEGAVLIDGNPLAAKDRARIGYLPERPPLYDALTVNQYLRFVADAKGIGSGERARAIGEAVACCEIVEVGRQPIGQLSKGFRQRVGLAQMVLGNPDILLLDEPTSGLDPVQIIEARALIRSQSRGRAMIYSSHIIQEVAALCDRVVILADGQLTEVSRYSIDQPDEERLQIEFTADNKRLLVERLNSLEGVSSVSLTPDNGVGKVKTLTCVASRRMELRTAIAEAVMASGRLLSLSALETDLETLFIEHIQRIRGDRGTAA